MAYQPLYEKSYALIIGINDYLDPHFPPLAKAEDDARELASILHSKPYNFETHILLGKNAHRQAIHDGLFQLRSGNPDDRLLIFFSGHGYTSRDNFGHEVGHLVCADTRQNRDDTALRMSDVTDLRNWAQAKHIAFIFDTCFSGQALGLTRSQTTSADQFLLRRAYQVISAGTPDQTVADHFSMTHRMLPLLKEPDSLLTIETIGRYLKESLAKESHGKQIPQYGQISGSEGGDFVFWGDILDLDPLKDLRYLITGRQYGARLGAVTELASLFIDGDDPIQHDAAREALEQLSNDNDIRVAKAAQDALLNAGVRVVQELVFMVGRERLPFEPEVVLIPAGEFLFGSNVNKLKQAHEDEPALISLRLPSYCIAKYPVTVEEYSHFINSGGYLKDWYWTPAGLEWLRGQDIIQPEYWHDKSWKLDDKFPVIGVSWYEAVAYCNWLSEKTGQNYRLPTEAQWEKAARGGLRLANDKPNEMPKRVYPWGDMFKSELCNLGSRSEGHISPVDSYPDGASPYGVLDMSGNVAEWCLSKYSNSYRFPEDNDVDGSFARVIRGGAWADDSPVFARIANREVSDSYLREVTIGFRCVCLL